MYGRGKMQEQIDESREQLEIEQKIEIENKKRADDSESKLELERAKNEKSQEILEMERARSNSEQRKDIIKAINVFTKFCCCKSDSKQ